MSAMLREPALLKKLEAAQERIRQLENAGNETYELYSDGKRKHLSSCAAGEPNSMATCMCGAAAFNQGWVAGRLALSLHRQKPE